MMSGAEVTTRYAMVYLKATKKDQGQIRDQVLRYRRRKYRL
jgi:hypothetical protein